MMSAKVNKKPTARELQAEARRVARHNKMLAEYRAVAGVDHPDYRPQLPPPEERPERVDDLFGEAVMDSITDVWSGENFMPIRGTERDERLLRNSLRRVVRSYRYCPHYWSDS